MNERFFKVVIYSPRKELYSYLHQNLIYQNLELFYLSKVTEIESYVKRVNPRVVVIYVSNELSEFRKTIEVIQKIHAEKDLWFLLLVDPNLPSQKLQTCLPIKQVLLHTESDDFQQIAHNLMFIRKIDQTLSQQQAQHQFEENINHCLKIIYQEKGLTRIFDRLVNYFPKIIMMDYWAIFTVDKQMSRIAHFSQFVPPVRRAKTTLTQHLETVANQWLTGGRAFLSTQSDDPDTFEKLHKWGWPVAQIYFLPIHLKEQTIGGLLIGNLQPHQLSAREIRFLNEIIQFLSRRILEETLSPSEVQGISDFSDKLLSNHLNEETIFQYTCQKLNEMTHADSTIFWQYNKGFGFLFPKFLHFLEGSHGDEPYDKDMIFLEKANFLRSLIMRGKLQTIDDVAAEERLDAASRKIFQKLQYRHLLIYPVRLNNEVTGALMINKTRPDDRFTVWQIHKVEEIVKRTQKVVEDTQAVKEAQLKLKQLSRIFELGREIKLGLGLYDILSRILLNLRKTIGWNDVAIMLTDDHEENLRLINRIGFNAKIEYGFSLNEPVPLSRFKEILANADRISHSYFLSGERQGNRNGGMKISPKITEWERTDLVIVPLETRKDVMGYLLVADPVDRLKPTVEKIIPLEYYANQAAVSVENTVLYEELRNSQERYRSLAETMNLGLVTCNTERTILYANPAFQELLGYNEGELLGQDVATFFTEPSQKGLRKMVWKLVDENDGQNFRVENLEFEIVGNADEVIPVNVHGFRFYERRKHIGFFLILNDLRMIKRLERMKADFNSMIVHDLRSPMNVIQGFVELIRNRVVGDINQEQEEYLDIVKENVKKVLALVDNFLVASKLEVGKFQIEPRLGEINGLIQRQVENHSVLFKNKNITVNVDLDPNLPMLMFDGLRIDQVLNNLLSNAMKFTPENGQVFVQSSLVRENIEGEEKLFVQVSVRDTGVGIPQDKLPLIFEKYEQVEANQNFNIRGTGLGLSICKEIINLHNGKIWVESDAEAGSTFHFTLPIEQSVENIMKT